MRTVDEMEGLLPPWFGDQLGELLDRKSPRLTPELPKEFRAMCEARLEREFKKAAQK